jgi:hypothetical protein
LEPCFFNSQLRSLSSFESRVHNKRVRAFSLNLTNRNPREWREIGANPRSELPS